MIWAIVAGYGIGSIPTADIIARASGHDLRRSGSGNPGTANALRVVGKRAAALILLLDMAKGGAAFLAGTALGGEQAGIAAAVAAIAGQVLNPWFGFKGGKGIGVTAGVTLATWPPGMLLVAPFAAMAARAWRAAAGAVVGLGVYLAGSVVWAERGWSTWWGVTPDDRLVWMAIGVVALTLPKFVADLRRPRTEQ